MSHLNEALNVESGDRQNSRQSTVGPPRMTKQMLMVRVLPCVAVFAVIFGVTIWIHNRPGGLSYFFFGFDCTPEQLAMGCTDCLDKEVCLQCIPGRELWPFDNDRRVNCYYPCTAEQRTDEQRCTVCENATWCSECATRYGFEQVKVDQEMHQKCKFMCTTPNGAIIEDTDYSPGACLKCLPGDKCQKCRDAYTLSPEGKCLLPQPGPVLNEFYMYRAASGLVGVEGYPLDGANLASAAGVMSYLHVEVVSSLDVGDAKPPVCARKYGIQKIQRWKVMVKNTPEVYAQRKGQFAQFMQFDLAQCTFDFPTFKMCDDFWVKYGYVVGCQPRNVDTFMYPEANWYSLPGTCPQQNYTDKKLDNCNLKAPGGACANPDGTPFCTYNATLAGEVSLDELVGICHEKDCIGFHEFCMAGKKEFKCPPPGPKHPPRPECNDDGLAVDFWKGYTNHGRNAERTRNLEELFQKNFPDQPQLTMPECDGF